MDIRVEDLKITLISQKGRFLLILFFKRLLKSSENLQKNGKSITKSFFSADNVTGFSVSLLLRKFLMQLSINLIKNAFSFKRLYNHLSENQMLYSKQFGFQRGHSTEHAIMQLTDQINSSFEKNHFTLGIFIDLLKTFDAVDHYILITNLENYGVNGKNLRWFQSYLKNRKQYLNFNNKITNSSLITCGVPQGSILGPLLLLIYVILNICIPYFRSNNFCQ